MISKAEGMHRVQSNYNGRFLIDSYNSLQNPGTIELVDHTGKSMRTLLQSKNPFENTEIEEDWGKLPPKLAKDLMEAKRERVSESYRKQVQAYFQAMSQKARTNKK